MKSGWIIIGAGGHAGVVIDAIVSKDETVAGILDDLHSIGSCRHGYQVLGKSDDWKGILQPTFIAIGDNAGREEVFMRIITVKDIFENVRHKTAVVGGYKPDMCFGTYFGANSVVGPNCDIGAFCIVNTGAILEHDSVLGDFSHLCPGVVTGGRVKIGSRTFVGVGACIRDGVTIGDNCTIGMGAVVTKSIPDNCKAWGNPARIIKR